MVYLIDIMWWQNVPFLRGLGGGAVLIVSHGMLLAGVRPFRSCGVATVGQSSVFGAYHIEI